MEASHADAAVRDVGRRPRGGLSAEPAAARVRVCRRLVVVPARREGRDPRVVEADPAGRRRGVRRPQTTRVGPPFQRRRRALRVVAAGPARAGAGAIDPGEAGVRRRDERRAHRAQLDDERRQVARPEPVRRERVDDRRHVVRRPGRRRDVAPAVVDRRAVQRDEDGRVGGVAAGVAPQRRRVEEVAVVERPRRDEAAPEPRPQELVLDRALQRAQAVGGARALSPQLAAVRAVVGAHDVLVQDAIVVRHRLIRGLRRDGLPPAEELELLQP